MRAGVLRTYILFTLRITPHLVGGAKNFFSSTLSYTKHQTRTGNVYDEGLLHSFGDFLIIDFLLIFDQYYFNNNFSKSVVVNKQNIIHHFDGYYYYLSFLWRYFVKLIDNFSELSSCLAIAAAFLFWILIGWIQGSHHNDSNI